MRAFLMLMSLLASLGAQADTRVIEVRSADPEALLAVVKPLLGPWETVSVYRQSLVLNAAPETLDRITALLGELDRPLRNLRIGVRKTTAQDREARGDADSTRISTRTRASFTEIRALEATPLLLQEGNLVPLPQGGLLGPEIRWEELQGGVALSVRLSAEQVILDVDLRDDTIDAAGVRKKTVRTTVSGRLGEWIRISDVDRQNAPYAGLGDTSTGPRDADGYEIRVELLP